MPLPDGRTIEQEKELFTRLQQNAEVIAEVYDVYADRLYGYLLKRCGHKQMAEDLVSRCFLKLLEARSTLEWRGVSLGAWLFRVAANGLADHWRSASVRMDVEMDDESGWELPSTDDPVWNAELKLEGERLQEALKTLAPRDQEVLTLKFYGEYETADIAAVLGVSENHAAVLVYRALGRLRKKVIT